MARSRSGTDGTGVEEIGPVHEVGPHEVLEGHGGAPVGRAPGARSRGRAEPGATARSRSTSTAYDRSRNGASPVTANGERLCTKRPAAASASTSPATTYPGTAEAAPGRLAFLARRRGTVPRGCDEVPVQEVEERPADLELPHACPVDDGLDGAHPVHLAEDALLLRGQADAPVALAATRRSDTLASSAPARPDLDERRVHHRPEHDVEGGDPLLDDGPLVHHPDPFHQDEVRAHGDEVLAVVVHRLRGSEVVATVPPAEHAEDDLRDLDLQRVAQVLGGDRAAGREDVAEPLQGLLLDAERLLEPLAAHLALLDEDVAEPVLEPAGRGVGHHHHAVLERHGDALVVLLVGQGEDAPSCAAAR